MNLAAKFSQRLEQLVIALLAILQLTADQSVILRDVVSSTKEQRKR